MTEAELEAVAGGRRPDAADRAAKLAVLDMGASAIRLAIAEIRPNERPRIIDEASKGVLLGCDTFSLGAIRCQTIDAAIAGETSRSSRPAPTG